MKRRLTIAVLCISLVIGNFAFQSEVGASSNLDKQLIIQPMFTNVNMFSNTFYIDDYGKATLYSYLSYRDADIGYVSVYLEKYNNGTWSQVSSWSNSSTNGTVNVSVNYYVPSNNQYRMRSTGSVWKNGRMLEMVTYISHVITS